MNVSAWSTTAASNDGADGTIGTVANTSAPNVVDDWVRGVMASVKRYVLDKDGGITAGGTADVITLTTNRVISSGHQAAGFSVRFKASATNTGAATVAVDGLSAVSIKRINGDALSAGDIVTGGIYDIAFDGTNYILMGAGTGSGTYGTLSGENTWSGVNTFTGTVTVGDGSGDVVVIKGTTVNSAMSSLLSSASLSAFLNNLSGAASGTLALRSGTTWQAVTPQTMLGFIGNTEGQILYRGPSGWTVLAPPASGQSLLGMGTDGTPLWRLESLFL
jgi:hypothetical protein